jgi:type II secretory pathway component PulF
MRLRHLLLFVDELSTLLRSGVPLRESLESLARGRLKSVAGLSSAAAQGLREGLGLAGALRAVGGAVPASFAAVIDAGERAGKLPQSLHRLRDDLQRRLELRRRMALRLAYPGALLVLCVALAPLYLVAQGETGAYLKLQASVFVPLAGAAALVWLWMRRERPLAVAIERVLLALPYLGGAVHGIVLGRALELLGLLLQAGMGFSDALPLVAASTRLRVLGRQFLDAGAAIARGDRFAEAQRSFAGLDPSVALRLDVGEQSGTLDRALAECGGALVEGGWRRFELAMRLAPIAAYLVLGWVVLELLLRRLGGGLG